MQKEIRFKSFESVNMLVIVSPECGIQKKVSSDRYGYWERHYNKTKQKGIKIAISCNGTFCMTEKEWEDFKQSVDEAMGGK